MRALFICLVSFFFAATACAKAADLDKTWSAGRLTWRGEGGVVSGLLGDSLAEAAKSLGPRKAPAVVYLHGCSGLDEISAATARFLAEAGYVVVSPDSFARAARPASCNVASHVGSLYRGGLALRRAEAAYAVAQVRRLPFVDPRRVYLYGFSEGAIAAATVTGVAVKARVVEGWSCHAGWPEYAGLHAPPGQPTLTFTSRDDPWFQAEWARGDCGDYMKGRHGSRSIVFAPPDPLSAQHYVSESPRVRETILRFLR